MPGTLAFDSSCESGDLAEPLTLTLTVARIAALAPTLALILTAT